MPTTATGIVESICIAPIARQPMVHVQTVNALAGRGLEGDRYCTGSGSYNKGKIGTRQVSLINYRFLHGSGFEHMDTRRNILTMSIPLHSLIAEEFQIGTAVFYGVEACTPCKIPSVLGGEKLKHLPPFNVAFNDCGGLLATVIRDGIICVGDKITSNVTVYV